MYLRILEPLVINKSNYEMMIATDSLKIVMALLMCQRLYSDFEGGESGRKIDGQGKLISEQSDPSLLNHVRYVKGDDWKGPNRTIKIMMSFKPSLAVIQSLLRDERSVMQFLDVPGFTRKLLLISQQMKDTDVIMNSLRIFGKIFSFDNPTEIILGKAPNLINYIFQIIAEQVDSPNTNLGILTEGLIALRNVSKKKQHTHLTRQESLDTLINLSQFDHTAVNQKYLKAIITNLKKNSQLNTYIDDLDLGDYQTINRDLNDNRNPNQDG